MNNPLVDHRHFENMPWKRELVWVQRNALGITVGMSEKKPVTDSIDLDLPEALRKERH